MTEYEFRQCEWEECRFRFPSEVGGPRAVRCPRCGAATDPAGLPALVLADPSVESLRPSLSALLDNIRSIHNVGSMFRSADGAGIDHLYLCGMTATPAHPKLSKAALGSQEFVKWSYDLNGVDLALRLKEQGHQLWGIEATEGAQLFFEADLAVAVPNITFVVGNERAGIDPGILTLCDRVLYLPMAGHKRSLNVAVTFGIVSYHLSYTWPSGNE
ncbi:MAG: TrmH family RNA methyltransferase [Candidatus Promineifilaceae bacterium]